MEDDAVGGDDDNTQIISRSTLCATETTGTNKSYYQRPSANADGVDFDLDFLRSAVRKAAREITGEDTPTKTTTTHPSSSTNPLPSATD
eukprot:4208360-Prorocentrum_lima.AAC.1